MKKQTIVELDLDVYGWIRERERVMEQIENHIAAMFRLHRHDTKEVRRTGCFHVELSLPKAEILPDSYDIEARTSQTIQVVDKLDRNAAKNYIQMCTRDHICVLAFSGPCNGFPRATPESIG